MAEVHCVYNAQDVGSFTAAWVVRSYYRSMIPEVEVQFHPTFGSRYPSGLTTTLGRDVILLGLACSAFVQKNLAELARSVLVISPLMFIKEEVPLKNSFSFLVKPACPNKGPARLTFEHFYGQDVEPRIVRIVETLLTDPLHIPPQVSNLLRMPATFELWDSLNTKFERGEYSYA